MLSIIARYAWEVELMRQILSLGAGSSGVLGRGVRDGTSDLHFAHVAELGWGEAGGCFAYLLNAWQEQRSRAGLVLDRERLHQHLCLLGRLRLGGSPEASRTAVVGVRHGDGPCGSGEGEGDTCGEGSDQQSGLGVHGVLLGDQWEAFVPLGPVPFA